MIIIKLLISGSRGIGSFDLSPHIPPNTDLIICGGAVGIDTIAEQYADQHRISKLILRPQYELYGKTAPLKRNERMIDIADTVLIIWDGISRGTKYTLELAKRKNKDIILIKV